MSNPFIYTDEQKSLLDTLRTALSEICSSEKLRKYSSDNSIEKSLDDQIQQLGINEFASDSATSTVDLNLIANEFGRALVPLKHLYEVLADCFIKNSLNINRPDKITFGFQFQNKSHISFLPSNLNSSCILLKIEDFFNQEVISLISFDKTNLTPHHSIDLVDRDYQSSDLVKEELTFNIAQSDTIKKIFLIAVASYCCGCLSKIFDLTNDYVKSRKQYGAPIGSFQAVQHQLSDVYLNLESSWSLCECAARSMDNFAVNSAIHYAAQVIPSSLETLLQLHGGIGFTWEYDLHLYLRKVLKLLSLCGISESSYSKILEQIN
jgi:hypothetical protein